MNRLFLVLVVVLGLENDEAGWDVEDEEEKEEEDEWLASWRGETTAGQSPSVTHRIRSSVLPRAEMLRQGHGLKHCLGFVHRLLEFRFGLRIIDPAAADLDEGPALLDERSADGDAAVEIAVE